MASTLAVRYRPKVLEQFVGQTAAIDVVIGLLRKGSMLGRGVFISGPTGVGKTSLARAIAHAVNCEKFNQDLFRPCGECSYCAQVKQGESPGVEEINFSDTRGIDTIRALIESLEFVSLSKARVFILDEMHNMTQQAADALLKVLEEPPENVLFLLLTTNPAKVIPTIRDRCTKLSLAKIEPEKVAAHLKLIAKKEGAALPDEVFTYIGKSCDGIMRNAISSLESVIALAKVNPDADLTDKSLLEDTVEESFTSPVNLAHYLIDGIYGGSYGKSLAALHRCTKHSNFNPRVFADKIYEYHLQTFYNLIDPTHAQKCFFNEGYYGSFYLTLRTQVSRKKGAFILTIESAEKLFDLIADLQAQVKNYDSDAVASFTVATIKMIRLVKENSAHAYTQKSPFHKTVAGSLCTP